MSVLPLHSASHAIKTLLRPAKSFLLAWLVALAGFIATAQTGWGQTLVQNFGTTTGSHASQTGSTTFLPNSTSGTTYARAGAAAATATVDLLTTSNPLGTTGAYVRARCSSSTSVLKLSPVVNYTSSSQAYVSFKLLCGTSTGVGGASSGTWKIILGDGAFFGDNNDFATAQTFVGLQLSNGASDALTLNYRDGSGWTTSSLTTSALTQGTLYQVEIVANNQSSGTLNYTYSGNTQSVAIDKFDLFINGIRVGNDLSTSGLTGGGNIDSIGITGVSSTSNVAHLFLDDVVVYNAVPASIGAATPTITATGTLSVVNTTYGTASTSPTSFSVSGANMSAGISVNPPANFEVSTNSDFSADNGTNGSPITVGSSGAISSTTIYVRLLPTAPVTGSPHSGNIVLSSSGASNVNVATTASSVSAKGLTITGLTGAIKVYDGSTTATFIGTAAYSGLVNSEAFSITGTPSTSFATAAVGTDKTITVTGFTAPSANYTVTQPTLTANIDPAPLTITADDVIKPFNTTLASPVTGSTAFSSTGLVNSETVGTVTLTYGAGAAAADPATTYANQAVPSAATGGTFTASNYAITYESGDIIVSANPTITVSGTLTAVNTAYGTASAAPTSFTASGGNLTGNLTVTAPSGFEVSTTAGSSYNPTLNLTATGGNVSLTTIYVRLAATAAAGAYAGNVTVSGGGATTQNVPTVSSTVAQKALTISGLTGENKVYDRSTTATVAGTATLNGIVGADDVTLGGSPTFAFADALVGTGKTITASGSTLSGSTAPNYTLTQPTGLTGDITAKALTIPDAAVATRAYNGTTTAAIAGTLTGIVSPDVVTFSGTGTFATADVGTGIAVTSTSTLGGAGAVNYSLTQPVGLTGDITQASQTITFGALAAKTTGDAPFALTATASSGLTVSYTSSNSAAATVSGNTVTIVGAGSTTITASQTGNGNYAAATPVDQSLVVTVGPTTLTAGDIAIIALQTDDADQFAFVTFVDLGPNTQISFTDNAWSGSALATNENTIVWQSPAAPLTKGSVITFTNGSGFSQGTSASGTFSGAAVGGDQVLAYQGSSTSPTFIYALSSTVWRTSGAVDNNTTYLPTALTNGTTARDFSTEIDNAYFTTVTNSGSKETLLAAIGNTATWTRSDTRFGSLPSWTFSITTPQTVTFGALASKTFGDAPFTLGATASSGLTVTYASSNTSVATVSGNTVTIVGAGSTNITASQAGDSTFAAATPVIQALTVNKADQTISGLAATDSKTYGDTAYDLAATSSSGLTVSYASSNTAVATISGATVTITGTGTTTITASQAGNANYNPASAVEQTLTVSPAALTITADNLTKVFGAALTSAAGSVAFSSSGLVNSETIGSITINYGSGAAAGDVAGVYNGAITPSAATGGTFTAANYSITYVAGNLTVSANPTIIVGGVFSAVDTIYGTASATPTSFTVSGGNLTGNLTVTAPAGFEVSTAIGSGYGSTANLNPTSGTLASTTIYVRLAATTAVGTYAGNVSVSGGGATTQNVATVSSTVAQKALTITGLTGVNKVYNRTTETTVSGTATLVGVVGSDDVSPSGTPEFDFDTAAVGTSKVITAIGYTLSGTAAGNYSVTQPTGLTADVTAASLTITGTAVTSKAYTGTDAAVITGTLSGVIAPDAVSLVGTGTFATVDVGTGIAVTSTSTLGGANAANYSLTQPVGLTGDINKADQTITFGTIPTKTTSDVPFNPGASASSGLVVTYTSSNPAVATISGSLLTIVGAGTSTITASQAGNSNYNAAVDVPRTLTVTAPPTTLAAGDVAFTAFQADNTGGSFAGDAFEFVLLVPVTTGTTIYFTDSGYQTDAAKFRTNENMVRWVAQSDLPAGTVKQFVAPGGTGPTSSAEWTGITPATGATLPTAPFGLAGGGDNIAALQNPTFASEAVTGTVIAQITFGGATFASTFTTSSGNSTTGLAGGLTDGVNAVSLAAADNGRYNADAIGSVEVGSKAAIAASISTDAHWQTSNTPFATGGANTTFTIATQPTVTTGTAGSIARTTAVITGNEVSSDGGSAITERGVVFGTSANPTIDGSRVVVSGTTGTFNANLSGLTMNATYYVRAYATNAAGTAYGAEVSFMTLANSPPTFAGMTVAGYMDTPVDVLLTKILAKTADANGDPITVSAATAATAQAGSATLGGTAITYTPASGFTGTDTLTFTLSDTFGTVNHDITVTVAADPVFTRAGGITTTAVGGNNRIGTFGIPGRIYGIQRSSTMAPGSWTQIARVTAGTDSTVNFEDPTPPTPSAFYRIVYPAAPPP